MKKQILTFLLFIIVTNCYSQDTIIQKSGDEFQGKVIEVGVTEIKYRKIDSLDGPLYSIMRTDVAMIRYENGTKDIFNAEKKSEVILKPTPTPKIYSQGEIDANKYYSDYSSAGTLTLFVSLFSPIIGLVPAIACSSTPPKSQNLNYPNPELMKKMDYSIAYSMKAKKIKNKKVWANWSIAFGVNVVVVLFILEAQQAP